MLLRARCSLESPYERAVALLAAAFVVLLTDGNGALSGGVGMDGTGDAGVPPLISTEVLDDVDFDPFPTETA